MAARGSVDKVRVVDGKGGEVLFFEVFGDAVDVGEFTIEILEVVAHFGSPEVEAFEVTDKRGVEDDEVAGQVAFDEEIFVGGLDAGGCTHDIGNGGGGSEGQDIGIAHAVFFDFRAQGLPVYATVAGDVDGEAALFSEEVKGVLWEKAAVPFRTFVGTVGAAFLGEIT